MGWWPGALQDDVIGDDPVDAFGAALGEAAARRGALLRPSEVLGALAEAVGGEVHGSGREGMEVAAATAGIDLVAAVHGALEQIAASYREELERDPRHSELAEIAAFVLGAPLPGVLADGPRVTRVTLS